MSLESFRQGLQFCFKAHCNRRFAHKDMRPQSWDSKSWESQFWEFRDSHLGVLRQNAIWMWVSWKSTKYVIKGKVVVSPKSRPW